jgi:hypothetical protein
MLEVAVELVDVVVGLALDAEPVPGVVKVRVSTYGTRRSAGTSSAGIVRRDAGEILGRCRACGATGWRARASTAAVPPREASKTVGRGRAVADTVPFSTAAAAGVVPARWSVVVIRLPFPTRCRDRAPPREGWPTCAASAIVWSRLVVWCWHHSLGTLARVLDVHPAACWTVGYTCPTPGALAGYPATRRCLPSLPDGSRIQAPAAGRRSSGRGVW